MIGDEDVVEVRQIRRKIERAGGVEDLDFDAAEDLQSGSAIQCSNGFDERWNPVGRAADVIDEPECVQSVTSGGGDVLLDRAEAVRERGMHMEVRVLIEDRELLHPSACD